MSGTGVFLRMFFAAVIALLLFDRFTRGKNYLPLTRLWRAAAAFCTTVTVISLLGFAMSYQHADELMINQGDGRLWIITSGHGRLRFLWANQWHDPYATIEHSRLESITTFYIGQIERLTHTQDWSSLERDSGRVHADTRGNRPNLSSPYRAVSFSWLLITTPAAVVTLLGALRLVNGLWLKGVREQRARRHRCRECGYDVRASARQCPECGTPVHAVHKVLPFLIKSTEKRKKK